MIASHAPFHKLPARTKLPTCLLYEELKLLVLPAHATVLLFLATHTHPLFAKGAFRVIFLNKAVRDVAKAILPVVE